MSFSRVLPPVATDSISNGNVVLIFVAIFLPIQLLFVLLRYYCRWTSRLSWGLDDFLVGLTAIGQIVATSLIIDAVTNNGFGHHILYLVFNFPEKLSRWAKELYVLELCYFIFSNTPKLAILVLYRRIFVGTRTRQCIHALMGILSLQILIFSLISAFQCTPVSAFWNTIDYNTQCHYQDFLIVWSGLPNIITDALMLALPLPAIWKLHAAKSIKVGLTITFLVGSLGLVTSIVRFVIVYMHSHDLDETWRVSPLLLCAELEAGCYLICACLTICRPLMERFFNSKIVQSLKSFVSSSSASKVGTSYRTADSGRQIQLQPQDGKATSRNSNGQGFYRLGDASSQKILVQNTFSTEEYDIESGIRTARGR